MKLDCLNAAKSYLGRGFQPIPIPFKKKAPVIAAWPSFRANGNLKEFSEPGNLGVLLGEPSRGLLDVDLDAPEALPLADEFVPKTAAVFGRTSTPRSHRLFRAKYAPGTKQFEDIDGTMLVEFRSTGAQTIFPPSTHPEGESISWDAQEFAPPPAQVDGEQLLLNVGELAAATLLVRHYPAEGARNKLALALAGALARAGWSEQRIAHFMGVVAHAAGDEETCERVKAGKYSLRRLKDGKTATGWPTVVKLLGKEVTQRLGEWLAATAPGDAPEFAEAAEGRKKKSQAKRQVDDQENSQATRLVELVLAQGVELFHDGSGIAYASAPVGEHRETWPTGSKGFRDFLAYRFYLAEKRIPSSQALHDAIQTLDGQARFEGHEESVYVRVGEDSDKLYLDLGDVDWTAVEISAQGWEFTKNPPVRFRRPTGLGALPIPIRGGDLDELRPFLNHRCEDGFVLICAWLVAAFRPRGPFPILHLVGEHGSAKSSAARILRRLIDPNRADLRTTPRDERDLLIAASNGVVIALDNISRLDPWLSDAMCRLATGGGLATRQLYTDAEEVIFDAQRPQLMNGIEEVGVRGDFLERSIIVHLRPILDGQRRDERTFWSGFERIRPRILGALLNAVSGALKNLNSVRPTELPRMADFFLWGIAAEPAMGFAPGTFTKAYLHSRADSNQIVLESSLIATYLVAIVEERDVLTITPADLLAELNQRVKESEKNGNSWPKSARALSGQMKRLAPTLRAVGIEYTPPDRRTAGRKLTLQKVASSVSSVSAATP